MKLKQNKSKIRTKHNAKERYEKSLNLKIKNSLFNTPSALTLWKKADDGIQRTLDIEEIYEKVPKELQGIRVKVLELHEFDCKRDKKTKLKKWLNR